jgi:hypothetical protein
MVVVPAFLPKQRRRRSTDLYGVSINRSPISLG